MPVETARISSFDLRPGTKRGEIRGDRGMCFGGLPRASNGPCRRAGGRPGDGPGGVYGRAPSARAGAARAPPPGRLRDTDPAEPECGGKRLRSAGDGAAPKTVCACLRALRCKGSFNCVPALISILCRWGRGGSEAPLHAPSWPPHCRPRSFRGATGDRAEFSHPSRSWPWCPEAC